MSTPRYQNPSPWWKLGSHEGNDMEQAASRSPETSSAETSRESWVVSLSEGEEQKVLDHENGEELAELLVDEAHFPPLDVGNAPPRDTGITPRVGSDHARTANPLLPVVNPSPADTIPPAGPANEADNGFPTNPTQPARGRSDRSRSRSPRAEQARGFGTGHTSGLRQYTSPTDPCGIV
ncbi:hypothetical protein MRX96_018047 [Rhipicephalus microplus]